MRRCWLSLFVLPALLAGCAVIPGSTYVPPERRAASRHVAYFEPRHPDKSTSYVLGVPKANPQWWIENTDDPPPEWWKPNEDPATRYRTWLMRNPFHNFTHYVIGVADRPTRRYGLNAHSIWNDRGPVNLAVTQSGPLLWLPMFSWRGWLSEGYFGWREKGNFGISVRPAFADKPAIEAPIETRMLVPNPGNESVPLLRAVPANP